MPNLRELRSRIRSIESTSRVTKALQMIAAAKMKKAQDKVLDGRAYSEKLNAIIGNVYQSNPEVFSSISEDEKNKILKLIKDESDPVELATLRLRYKYLRNSITNEKRSNKKEYFAQKFLENKNNSSKIWKEIKSLVNLKSNKTSSIKILDENQTISSDSQKNCKYFQ